MVQEFYSTLQVVDIDEDKWEVYIHGQPIRISPYILSTYLRIPRQVGPYLAVDPATALSAEEIFRLMTGEDQYLVQSSVSQSSLPDFWNMFHLIFSIISSHMSSWASNGFASL
ncbi:hypothetical protein CJ030_MR4G028671 [Morella rubra]|uniref:Uncharacterized protein n=1 Tax=Morella rubra TaxID=262757 RepID=A0A6A1VVF6_9ROSI|nr:hypothetical protein CJ030_MR4G028671 [Morella rubra]